MKKWILCLLITIQISITQALSPQNIQDIVDAFEKPEQNQSQRIQNLTSLNNILHIAYQRVQPHIKPIIIAVQEEIQNRLTANQSTTYQTPYPLTTQKRLDLHNSVRSKPVQLHPALMRSAQIRATHLSENNIISGTHARPGTQGRNTAAITQRFKDLGITFTSINGRAFSENIAYNSVKCSTQNCDQELLTATDRSRKFFYTDEKQEQKSHYRAIVQENFQYIGVGIAINNGRYHIVIHYGTDIKEPLQLTKK
jgi:hypothetical protein